MDEPPTQNTNTIYPSSDNQIDSSGSKPDAMAQSADHGQISGSEPQPMAESTGQEQITSETGQHAPEPERQANPTEQNEQHVAHEMRQLKKINNFEELFKDVIESIEPVKHDNLTFQLQMPPVFPSEQAQTDRLAVIKELKMDIVPKTNASLKFEDSGRTVSEIVKGIYPDLKNIGYVVDRSQEEANNDDARKQLFQRFEELTDKSEGLLQKKQWAQEQVSNPELSNCQEVFTKQIRNIDLQLKNLNGTRNRLTSRGLDVYRQYLMNLVQDKTIENAETLDYDFDSGSYEDIFSRENTIDWHDYQIIFQSTVSDEANNDPNQDPTTDWVEIDHPKNEAIDQADTKPPKDEAIDQADTKPPKDEAIDQADIEHSKDEATNKSDFDPKMKDFFEDAEKNGQLSLKLFKEMKVSFKYKKISWKRRWYDEQGLFQNPYIGVKGKDVNAYSKGKDTDSDSREYLMPGVTTDAIIVADFKIEGLKDDETVKELLQDLKNEQVKNLLFFNFDAEFLKDQSEECPYVVDADKLCITINKPFILGFNVQTQDAFPKFDLSSGKKPIRFCGSSRQAIPKKPVPGGVVAGNAAVFAGSKDKFRWKKDQEFYVYFNESYKDDDDNEIQNVLAQNIYFGRFKDLFQEATDTWTQGLKLKFTIKDKFIPKQAGDTHENLNVMVLYTGCTYCIGIGKQIKRVSSEFDHNLLFGFEEHYNVASLEAPQEEDIVTTRSNILHELGHALGLEHEHQSPDTPYVFNEKAVIEFYIANEIQDGRTEEEKREAATEAARINVLNKVDTNNYTVFDKDSIMLYPMPKEWILEPKDYVEAPLNLVLSEMDKKFIKEFYGEDEPIESVNIGSGDNDNQQIDTLATNETVEQPQRTGAMPQIQTQATNEATEQPKVSGALPQMQQQILTLSDDLKDKLKAEILEYIEDGEDINDIVDTILDENEEAFAEVNEPKKALVKFIKDIQREQGIEVEDDDQDDQGEAPPTEKIDVENIKVPVIPTFEVKQKLINHCLKKDFPTKITKLQAKKQYAAMIEEDILQVKSVFETHKVISFVQDHLFKEEIQRVIEMRFSENKQPQEISSELLIYVELIEKIVEDKLSSISSDKELISSIGEYVNSKSNADIALMVIQDGVELIQVLENIFKQDQDTYNSIIASLTEKNLASAFLENSILAQLLKSIQSPQLLNAENTAELDELNEQLEQIVHQDLELFLAILQSMKIKEPDENDNIQPKYIYLKNKKDKNLLTFGAMFMLLERNKALLNSTIKNEYFASNKLNSTKRSLELEFNEYSMNMILQNHKKAKLKAQKGQQQQDDQIEQYTSYKKLQSGENSKKLEILANIIQRNIELISSANWDNRCLYKPNDQRAQTQADRHDTLHLLLDDKTQEFQMLLIIQIKRKIPSVSKLAKIKLEYPFMERQIPKWLETFIPLRNFDEFMKEDTIKKIKILQNLSDAQENYLNNNTDETEENFYNKALDLEKNNEQLFKEWYMSLSKLNDDLINQFCKCIKEQRQRLHSDWILDDMRETSQCFPIKALKKTLEDFNRVQSRSELDDRKQQLNSLQGKPKELTEMIINTCFGYILRKENLNEFICDIEEVIPGRSISKRFIISFLLQQADQSLRTRLNHYLCQNAAIPLVMNCQKTFESQEFNMIYNHDLIFSMNPVEGAGVFSFGIGLKANFPIGKSEILNQIVIPSKQGASMAFDMVDNNTFSNGQVDVYFEKQFEVKNQWVAMDGQGKVSLPVILNVLHLTNVVIIHFHVSDFDNELSLNELHDTIKAIKDSDQAIKICLLLRDCKIQGSRVLDKLNFPPKFQAKESVDQIIQVQNLSNVRDKMQKMNYLSPVIKFYNESVKEFKNNGQQQKFTRQNYKDKFLKEVKGQEPEQNLQNIQDIITISNKFMDKVYKLGQNVFSEEGLPSLEIKDNIREINLDLRNFASEGDQKTQLEEENKLNNRKKEEIKRLDDLQLNELSQIFLDIVTHKFASIIKFEIAKSLAKFTYKNTIDDVNAKSELIKQQSEQVGDEKLSQEQKEENLRIYEEKMEELMDKIFKKSLSYEYFWRALITILLDSKKCQYWTQDVNKMKFKESVQRQMLDGDCFELIDGRTLEMRADILSQVIGDIDSKKCVVAAVIGPQSTGKSTLMNFCFGTQFVASTGRCTQGIYFTLQKLPKEMCEGTDVEYFLILDTEGLNSPERHDKEYDRKIVLFTLMCSDFLIINSRGDMTDSMISILKICAVSYDKLKQFSKPPKILYTFVQNSDTNQAPLLEQVSNLRTDLIKSSDSETIQETANQLFGVRDDLIRVLGTAYGQDLIDKDATKGIEVHNKVTNCSPIFGVQANSVFQIVHKFLTNFDGEFRQLGAWFEETRQNWKVIDQYGADILQFGDITEMKNDLKIRKKLNTLWQDYMSTENQVVENDKKKANEGALKLIKIYKTSQTNVKLNQEQDQILTLNDNEKDKDFQERIVDKFEEWKTLPQQKSLTHGSEEKHMQDLKTKLKVLKNDFYLLLDSKFQEQKMVLHHKEGLRKLITEARRLSQDKEICGDQKKIIEQFDKCWSEAIEEMTGGAKVSDIRKTYADNLTKTFKGINKFMPDIKPEQFEQILQTIQNEDKETGIPFALKEWIQDQVKTKFFTEDGKINTQAQFKFNKEMLKVLVEDPKERLFGSKPQYIEEYMRIQRFVYVDYYYSILPHVLDSLNTDLLFMNLENLILHTKVKDVQVVMKTNTMKKKYKSEEVFIYDNEEEIINTIDVVFDALGKAGFKHRHTKINRVLPDVITDFELKKYQCRKFVTPLLVLKENKVQDSVQNDEKKTQWLASILHNLVWFEDSYVKIDPLLEQFMMRQEVHMLAQAHPHIGLEEHRKKNFELRDTLKENILKPRLTYNLCKSNRRRNKDTIKEDFQELFEQDDQYSKLYQYEKTLLEPQSYDIGDAIKWRYLAELANMLVDWDKIVDHLDEAIIRAKIIQEYDFDDTASSTGAESEQDTMEEQFDLEKILELNQISIKDVQNLQNIHVQMIADQLDREVQSKLSLFSTQKLNGVLTWATMVMCWFKLQKNVIFSFNRQLNKFAQQRDTYKDQFMQIVEGKTTVLTKKSTEQMFNDVFKDFNDAQKLAVKSNISSYLQSKHIRDKFDTEKVYDYMDNFYLTNCGSDYDKFVEYVHYPAKLFREYVEGQRQQLIDYQIREKYVPDYKSIVTRNLIVLQKRLKIITDKIMPNEQKWRLVPNLFFVNDQNQKRLSFDELLELATRLSPIILKILVDILMDRVDLNSFTWNIKVNKDSEKQSFKFIIDAKEAKEDVEEAPLLQSVMKLNFEQENDQSSMVLYNNLVEYLDLLKKDGKAEEKGFIDIVQIIESISTSITQKINKIESEKLNEHSLDCSAMINDLVNEAIGCPNQCNFCNRKCELKAHEKEVTHCCDKRGHQMRVFGGGHFVGPSGKYPSLKVCDEIKDNQQIQIVNARGETEKMLWSQLHDVQNVGWDRKFIKDSNKPVYNAMQHKMTTFWNTFGQEYSRKNGYHHIKKNDTLTDETKGLHERAIVILCLDDSGSMFPRDFPGAVQGGKDVVKYLKDNYSDRSIVDLQLWYNDCRGVTLVWEGKLSEDIPADCWDRTGCLTCYKLYSKGDTSGDAGRKVPASFRKINRCDWYDGQFQGAINILNKEVNQKLKNNRQIQQVFYFFFTDGGAGYPMSEVDTFKSLMTQSQWLNLIGKPKLMPMIMTNQLTVASLTRIKKELDEAAKASWGIDNFCTLVQNVPTSQLGSAMIEQFKR